MLRGRAANDANALTFGPWETRMNVSGDYETANVPSPSLGRTSRLLVLIGVLGRTGDRAIHAPLWTGDFSLFEHFREEEADASLALAELLGNFLRCHGAVCLS